MENNLLNDNSLNENVENVENIENIDIVNKKDIQEDKKEEK